MHFNSRTRVLLVSLSIVVHLLAGCKKGAENPTPTPTPPEPATTTAELEKNSYKFYEIAVVRLKNNQPQNTILDATVGGTGVKIAVASDTTLVFSVWPTVYKEGSNTLKFSIAGKSYSVGINVQATLPVSNPESVFTTYKNSLTQNVAYFDDLKRRDTTGVISDATVVNALAYAKEQISKLDNEWAALSAEQKLAVANFFQANDASLDATNQTLKELTDFLYQGGLTFRIAGYICETGTPVERYKCVAGTLVREAQNIVKWGFSAYLAAQTIPAFATPFPLLAGIPAAISIFCSTKAIISGLNFVYIGLQFLKINAKIVALTVMNIAKDGLRVTGDPNTFYKDAAMPFPVKMTLRNVVAEDASSPLTWLADLVKAINSYNSLCDEYPTAFGKYKLQFRNPVQKQFNLFRLPDVSIKNISNPKVTGGTIGGTANAPTLTFSTKETTDQEFSFDVVYDDKVNTPVTVTVNAKLIANNRLVGTWKAIELMKSGTDLFDGYSYSLAACVTGKVQYDDWKLTFYPDGKFDNYQGYVNTHQDYIPAGYPITCSNRRSSYYYPTTYNGTYNIDNFNTHGQTGIQIRTMAASVAGGLNEDFFTLKLLDDVTMELVYTYNGYTTRYVLKKQP